MNKLTVMLGLSVFLFSTAVQAQVSEAEVEALRAQIEMLTKRLDELERQSAKTAAAPDTVVVIEEERVEPETVVIVEEDEDRLEALEKQVAAMSWAERLRWKGDFRYRYENIDEEGKEGRNRNRIRARAHLEADLSPTLEVGIGLATGGDDPVSTNQTLGGGGATKDVRLDLAYFRWSGLEDTTLTAGKFSNFLVRPGKAGIRWDGDWRPEGIGANWDNGTFFVHGLGTWLEGDSRKGTEFAWIAQAGMNLGLGETGKLKFGLGYSEFNIAGRTPVYGDPEDFYGNSYVVDPVTRDLVYRYDYRNIEAFFDYSFKLGGKSAALFGVYTVNQDADSNDTGYLLGGKYGSAKRKGEWDVGYFYQRLEADATIGLVTDSDFAGGGTDNKGHALFGSYAFHEAWSFKATYFINQVELDDPRDYDRLMLDLNFKFQ